MTYQAPPNVSALVIGEGEDAARSGLALALAPHHAGIATIRNVGTTGLAMRIDLARVCLVTNNHGGRSLLAYAAERLQCTALGLSEVRDGARGVRHSASPEKRLSVGAANANGGKLGTPYGLSTASDDLDTARDRATIDTTVETEGPVQIPRSRIGVTTYERHVPSSARSLSDARWRPAADGTAGASYVIDEASRPVSGSRPTRKVLRLGTGRCGPAT